MIHQAYRSGVMTLLAFVLVLPTSAQNDEEIPATTKPKDTWSRYGWQTLRWGMGPGDARATLAPTAEVHWSPGTMKRSGDMFVSAGWNAHGAECGGKLSFVSDTLTELTLIPSCRQVTDEPEETPKIECVSWVRGIREFYDKAAGPARCKAVGKTEDCAWERDDLRVVLSTYQSKYTLPSLIFDDPERNGGHLTKSELAAKTDPNTWKTDGWFEFRWGMGIGDVTAKLRGGEIKSTRDMLCHHSRYDENDVECQLESTYHSLRVLDSSPDLRFCFVNGALYSVTVRLSPSEEPGRYDEILSRAGAALSDKYGIPTRENNTNGFLSKEWKRDTLEVSLDGYKDNRGPIVSVHYFDPASRGQFKRKGTTQDSRRL